MKIAVIADIHGNAVALEAVLREIREEGIRDCVFLGDLVAKGPQPLEVLELLSELRPIRWILGNTDLWAQGEFAGGGPREKMIRTYQAYMKQWLSPEDIRSVLRHPKSAALSLGTAEIRCLHGSARSVSEGIAPDEPVRGLYGMLSGVREPIVLCGHTHLPFFLGSPRYRVFNPGSVGSPYDGNPDASYGVITYDPWIRSKASPGFSIRRVSYPREEILRIARLRDYPFPAAYAELLRNGRKRFGQ